jgi:hypothetical protein
LEKCPESGFEGLAIDAGGLSDAHENEGGSWSCKARKGNPKTRKEIANKRKANKGRMEDEQK